MSDSFPSERTRTHFELNKSRAKWLMSAAMGVDKTYPAFQYILYRDGLAICTNLMRMHVARVRDDAQNGVYVYNEGAEKAYRLCADSMLESSALKIDGVIVAHGKYLAEFGEKTYPLRPPFASDVPGKYVKLQKGFHYCLTQRSTPITADLVDTDIVCLGINVRYQFVNGAFSGIGEVRKDARIFRANAVYLAQALGKDVRMVGVILGSNRPMLIGDPQGDHAILMGIRD